MYITYINNCKCVRINITLPDKVAETLRATHFEPILYLIIPGVCELFLVYGSIYLWCTLSILGIIPIHASGYKSRILIACIQLLF